MNLKQFGYCVVFIAAFLGSLSLGSCKKQSSGENEGEVTHISFSEEPSLFRPIDGFKDISCVQLEMTEESLLGEIKSIMDVDGKLIILTLDNEIVVFNREDGKYIRHIGGAGEGPEEYLDAQDIFYNSKAGTVDVYDRLRNDIVSYRVTGEFVGKKPLPKISPYIESIDRAADGTLLVCNQIAGGLSSPSDYAFTLISPDGKQENLDPFAPVTVDGYSKVFASRPMSVYEDQLKFVGFLSDTLSCVKGGKIESLYKLDFENKIVSKKVAADLGYGNEYIGYCMREELLQGIDEMYETAKYLVLSPILPGQYGIYWIDKETLTGYHIPPGSNVDSNVRKVVTGDLIIKLLGYNENELICCFQDLDIYKRIFTEAISEIGEDVALPESVVSAIENVDPEGNPFLLIYSH